MVEFGERVRLIQGAKEVEGEVEVMVMEYEYSLLEFRISTTTEQPL